MKILDPKSPLAKKNHKKFHGLLNFPEPLLDEPKKNPFFHRTYRLSFLGKVGSPLYHFLEKITDQTPAGWPAKIVYGIFLVLSVIRDIFFRGSVFSNISYALKKIKHRLVILPSSIEKKIKAKKCIWLHATGLGEWNLLDPMLQHFLKNHSDYLILLSCPYKHESDYIQKKYPQMLFIHLPYSCPFILRKFFRLFTIKLFIMCELFSQVKPPFLNALKKNNAVSLLFNGRVAPDTTIGLIHRMYIKGFGQRKEQAIFQKSDVDYLLMQDEIYARQLGSFGAKASKMLIYGNTKYDSVLSSFAPDEKKHIYEELRINPESLILLAGSTHPGEPEIILNIFRELKKKYHSLVLIIAPRYLADIALIDKNILNSFVWVKKTDLSKKEPISPTKSLENSPFRRFADFSIRWCIPNFERLMIDCAQERASMPDGEKSGKDSKNGGSPAFPEVIILDTLGELKKIYSIPTITIICGSFFSFYSGHNFLEPAKFSKPIIFGPFMQNFDSIAQLFLKEKAALQVKDKKQLLQVVENLLEDKALREKYGNNAHTLLKKNSGALKRSIHLIDQILLE